MEVYQLAMPHTMTSTESIYAAWKVVEYVVNANIEGDIVECSVWHGISSMIMALKRSAMKSFEP